MSDARLLVDVLGPNGSVARALARYEERPGQMQMAERVLEALENGHHLFVEAGTGTGKTLAYLTAAVLSGQTVVISTATRALQDQIFEKDLPLLRAALAEIGLVIDASMMKGLTNYVCKRRLAEALAESHGESAADRALARVADWVRESESGDVSSAPGIDESAPVWLRVRSSSDTRIGAQCRYFEECFVTKMRRDAESARILVVNHHLFFADLALKGTPQERYASVLPPYDAVIFDEAHQLVDVASDFFGTRVSSKRFETLVKDAEKAFLAEGIDDGGAYGPVAPLVARVDRAAKAWLGALPLRAAGEKQMLSASDLTVELRQAEAALDDALGGLLALVRTVERTERLSVLARRLESLRADLAEIFGPGDLESEEPPTAVTWVEAKDRGTAVGTTQVELGPTLKALLFDRVASVVCTSATLSVGGDFHFIKSSTGAADDVPDVVVPSPFDFENHAALYVAGDLPDPKAPGFEVAGVQRAEELIELSGGGAFVLCTSLRSMKRYHEHIKRTWRGPVYVQGAESKAELLNRFRASTNAVLVATMTFWEGVDVPGHALRLVILDKLPFPVPSDPVVMARSAHLDRQGGNSFAEYMIPHAAITLKQGFGRLIRTQSDRGLVALLDSRAKTKGYAKRILRGLPPARRLDSMDDVRAFWATALAEP